MMATTDGYRRAWKGVVRCRLREGWEAWTHLTGTHWARILFGPDRGSRPRSERLQIQVMSAGELAVLDEVLREKAG